MPDCVFQKLKPVRLIMEQTINPVIQCSAVSWHSKAASVSFCANNQVTAPTPRPRPRYAAVHDTRSKRRAQVDLPPVQI
jgi:hypothetical protein